MVILSFSHFSSSLFDTFSPSSILSSSSFTSLSSSFITPVLLLTSWRTHRTLEDRFETNRLTEDGISEA
ncbi:hypothetical protein F2P79_011607 [Pimephales promelas]|nr:hypothetical protein F2P79_011607 [Pimephales promelas]